MKLYASQIKLPALPKKKAKVKRKPQKKKTDAKDSRRIEVVFIMDDSGSMCGTEKQCEKALYKVLGFLKAQAPKVRFSYVPYTWHRADHPASKCLRVRIPAFEIAGLCAIASGGTCSNMGIEKGIDCALQSPKKSRIFFLILSDGDFEAVNGHTGRKLERLRKSRETLLFLLPMNTKGENGFRDISHHEVIEKVLRPIFIGKTAGEAANKVLRTLRQYL